MAYADKVIDDGAQRNHQKRGWNVAAEGRRFSIASKAPTRQQSEPL
jgi:hypothetical protein